VQRFSISDGDAGVAQTVAHMQRLICESVATPIVRDQATRIVAGCDAQDRLGQCYALREWLANHIVFLRDPVGVELLHTPEWLLRTIHQRGCAHVDCDDAAILGGALSASIGLAVIIVTVAFLDKCAPYSHVWSSAAPSSSGPWIELDVTRPMQNLPADAISRSQIYPVCG
jgi:hypothetical protein